MGAAACPRPRHGGEGVAQVDLCVASAAGTEGGERAEGTALDGHRFGAAVGLGDPRRRQLHQGSAGLGIVDGGSGLGLELAPAAHCGWPAEVGFGRLVLGGRIARFPRLQHERQLDDLAVDAVVVGQVLAAHDALLGGDRRLRRRRRVRHQFRPGVR